MNWDALLVIVGIWFAGYFFNKWQMTSPPRTPEQLQQEENERKKRDQEVQERIKLAGIVRERRYEEWQAAYKDYLKSEKWQKVRRRVLKRADQKCEYCGAHAVQVHHEKYPKSFSRMEFERENFSHLKAVCGKCHMEQHDIS